MREKNYKELYKKPVIINKDYNGLIHSVKGFLLSVGTNNIFYIDEEGCPKCEEKKLIQDIVLDTEKVNNIECWEMFLNRIDNLRKVVI